MFAFRRSIRFLGLLFLVAASAAQSTGPGAPRRAPAPIRRVHLDLATGVTSHGPAVHDRSATTIADFSNMDLGGFIGTDSGGGACAWFQAGTKGVTGNQSDLMASIVFPYCTSKASPPSGPGGTVRLGFYEGYALGGGVPTTAVAVFTLSGLPGNSASSGLACYFLQLSFGSLVSFADGPIGYSWGFLDLDAGGVLAATVPFLASPTSGTPPPGVTGFIDRYCPPGGTAQTISFGFFTSIAMEIREVTDTTATSVAYNALTTPNPDQISAVPVIVGSNWVVSLLRGAPTAPGSFVVNLRPNRIPLANGVQGPAPLPVGGGGRVLISGPLLGSLSGAHNGIAGNASAAIPASLGLVCLHFAGQATVLGGGVRLSSAIEGTTGTF